MITVPPPEILGASSESITASSGSNLALAFICLPPDRRRAMSIFYAFCRVIDDAADSETLTIDEKRGQLAFWRSEIQSAFQGSPVSSLGREMAEIIHTYQIPAPPLEEILLGVEMDLTIRRYQNFSELERYCYRVASAVGLVSIEIFSYRQPQTRDYAVALGMAFQLTNILRDVCKDAPNDRIYLPLDEMQAHSVTEDDILQKRFSPGMRKLLHFQYHRAKHYFAKSLRLIHPEDRPNLTASEIMREVYETLLEKIHCQGFELHDPPLRLSKPAKIGCILKARHRQKQSAPLPPRPKSILILGGGLAGLSAALQLSRRGHAVTLLESKPHLGGRAYSFRDPRSGETVDNGQHVLMGCYHESLHFLRQLEVMDKLHVQTTLQVPFVSDQGFSELAAADYPSPWHLLVGLWNYRELTLRDRIAALRLGLQLRMGPAPRVDETASNWLKRLNQPANLIRALWEPLCLAAVNQQLRVCSAALLSTVLRRALFGPAKDSTLIVSRVGLSDLFSQEIQQVLHMCSGTMETRRHVTRLNFVGNSLTEVETLDGKSFSADHVISTLPWNAIRPLLPSGSRLACACGQIEDSTIISLYLWLDRPLEIPMIQGFLDSPLHWLFSREQIEERITPGRHAYVAVISGANEHADQSAEAIEKMVVGELHKFLPSARSAKVVHRFLYKAMSATFSATPQTERLRPRPVTEWSNFWLAGDWTNVGLPSTIEGAILSGRLVAEAVDAAQ